MSSHSNRNLTESGTAIQKAAERVISHAHRVSDHAHRVSDRVSSHAASTARIVISAEEKLRQRVRSLLRVAVATIFFGISGLISLGANVTTAFAKKVSSGKTNHGVLKVKKAGKHHSGRVHHAKHGKLRHHHHGAARTELMNSAHHRLQGVASWYGGQFNHRKTASGVRFNTHAMMAAHRTLPFGTRVRVTNLKNDRSCIVEITDRGPYSHGRIIDLSYAAAERIGMTQTGTAEVQLEILSPALEPASYEDIAVTHMPAIDKVVTSRSLASMLNAPVMVEDDDQ